MTATISLTESQREFYRRWLMGRAAFDPKDYAVDMERTAFIDLMAEDFSATFRGTWTIDDLSIRPEDAHDFCKAFRSKHQCPEVPQMARFSLKTDGLDSRVRRLCSRFLVQSIWRQTF